MSVTERNVLDALRMRYSAVSQGTSIRYVVAEHVRNSAGFWANRTIDFMALDVWESSGLALHGHEVKCSRSDWLRELKTPGKAEALRRYCDRWWLVVPDRTIVKDHELPEGWGLMVATGQRVRVAIAAPRLTPEPWPRTFVAAFARAVQKTGHPAITGAVYAPEHPAGDALALELEWTGEGA